MYKKFSKFLLTLLLIILTISSLSICYATEAVTTSEVVAESETASASEEDTSATEQEIHNGDLYLFDTNIVMDKLVDGNVFLFGSNVEITGQINGNLFVFSNKVSFNECYVKFNIFVCANSVYYNGACNDLYVATNDLEMTYNSYVIRDVKAIGSNFNFFSAIGRNVDFICDTINFGEDENIPIVYGDLRYSANKEAEIPEGVITENGTVTYTKPSNFSVIDILIAFTTCVVTVLALYSITKKLSPNFAEKLSNQKLSVIRILKALGIGLASLIIVVVAVILLLLIAIGSNLSLILLLLYSALCLIAAPAFAIVITYVLKPTLKLDKTYMFYLTLTLVSIVLYGITLIPVVGGILGFIIKMIAIGLLIDMYLPHKELTDEEKAAKKLIKEQAKADKEKRKQERIEAKKAKKDDEENNIP